MICEACDGTGWVEQIHPAYGRPSCPEPTIDVRCECCGGVGSVARDEDEEADEAAEV